MWILNYGKFSVFDKISPVSIIHYPSSDEDGWMEDGG
jgi:hypothetical protein